MADLSLEGYNEEYAITVLSARSTADAPFPDDAVLQIEADTFPPQVIHGVKGIAQFGEGVHGEGDKGAVGVGQSIGGMGYLGQSTDEGGHLIISDQNLPEGWNHAGMLGTSYIGDRLSAGVIGANDVGVGVFGRADDGTGIFGSATGDYHAAVAGLNSSTGPGVLGSGGVGVHGIGSDKGKGVYGEGHYGVSGSGDYGVHGYAPSTGIAVTGHCEKGGIAGVFVGDVMVLGSFVVMGPNPKSAAVPHRDGSHRLLYSMESPESWFEDFGEAKLTNGRAKVRLDPEFAALVKTSSYHVFVTPYSNSNGLYVSNRTGKGFEVREQNGGKSKTRFSYRIIAKRKDITGERLTKLAKFTVPPPPSRPGTKIPAPPTRSKVPISIPTPTKKGRA